MQKAPFILDITSPTLGNKNHSFLPKNKLKTCICKKIQDKNTHLHLILHSLTWEAKSTHFCIKKANNTHFRAKTSKSCISTQKQGKRKKRISAQMQAKNTLFYLT